METVADKADWREVNGIRVYVNLAVLGTLTAAGGKTSAAFFLRCDDRARAVGSCGFTGSRPRPEDLGF